MKRLLIWLANYLQKYATVAKLPLAHEDYSRELKLSEHVVQHEVSLYVLKKYDNNIHMFEKDLEYSMRARMLEELQSQGLLKMEKLRLINGSHQYRIKLVIATETKK